MTNLIETPQEKWPSFSMMLLFIAAMSGAALFLYNAYPYLFGWLAGGALGWGELPGFFARHSWIYAAVQAALRGIYAFSVVAVFTLILFFFVYALLDETVFQKYTWKERFWLAVRAAVPAWGLQLAGGMLCMCVLGWIKAFNSLYLLPSFWTANAWQALYTVLWEMALCFFACAFILTGHWKSALVKSKDLFCTHLRVWLLLGGGLFLLTWMPAWSLQRLHITSSVVYLLGGVFVQMYCLGLGLILFFQQSGEFTSVCVPDQTSDGTYPNIQN